MCYLVLRTLLPFIHRSLPPPYSAQVNIRHCLFRIFAKDVVFHQISRVKPSVLTDNDGTPTPTISAEFIFHYFGIYQLSDTICMRKAICHQQEKKMLSYEYTLYVLLRKYKWKTKYGIMRDNTTWFDLYVESKEKVKHRIREQRSSCQGLKGRGGNRGL